MNDMTMQNQDKVVANIWTTNDYSRFTILDQNKDYNPERVEDIKLQLGQNPVMPICVNELGQIIHGTLTYIACKELNIPVYYYTINGYSEHHAAIAGNDN